MSDYDNKVFDSDLDAFKIPSAMQEMTLTLQGTVGSNGIWEDRDSFEVADTDFGMILFDNSLYHPGKYKDVKIELATTVRDTTTPSYLPANIYIKVSGSTITIGAEAINPYAYSATIDSVDLNIKYIPYQGTF